MGYLGNGIAGNDRWCRAQVRRLHYDLGSLQELLRVHHPAMIPDLNLLAGPRAKAKAKAAAGPWQRWPRQRSFSRSSHCPRTFCISPAVHFVMVFTPGRPCSDPNFMSHQACVDHQRSRFSSKSRLIRAVWESHVAQPKDVDSQTGENQGCLIAWKELRLKKYCPFKITARCRFVCQKSRSPELTKSWFALGILAEKSANTHHLCAVAKKPTWELRRRIL